LVVAERGGGAEHRSALRVPGLQLPRRVRLDRAEHEIDPGQLEAVRVLDGQVEQLSRRLFRAPPPPGAALGIAQGGAVGLARRSLRGGQGHDLEPGMLGEGEEKLLAGDAGRSHDGDTLPHDMVSLVPETHEARDHRGGGRGPRGFENGFEWSRSVAGRASPSRWASRRRGPQPGLVAGALRPADHAGTSSPERPALSMYDLAMLIAQ